jgi:hypothetical protein
MWQLKVRITFRVQTLMPLDMFPVIRWTMYTKIVDISTTSSWLYWVNPSAVV